MSLTWTSRTSAANLSWKSVTYGNGLFVAVATFSERNLKELSGMKFC